ncbi:MAG TPA: hypothetical protein VFU15_02815 [Bacteroidia bacterium]|nr:hypothetical protein [Bacteroidia bacterium]
MQTNISTWTVSRLCIAAILFVTAWCARVTYTFSDPQLSLLTSQALLENGSINLYRYKTAMPSDQFSSGNWKFTTCGRKETCYYSYPLGNSFLSLPFVAAANFFGLDMANTEQDAFLQHLLATCCTIVLFFLLCRIARLFLDEIPALVAATAISFGTGFISVVTTALWSFDIELILVLVTLDYLLRYELKLAQKKRPVLLGLLVFFAWFCRPSAAIVAALAGAWMFFRQRRQLPLFILSLLVPLGVFMWLSYRSYGVLFPSYYNPLYWEHTASSGSGFFQRMSALLFSPARGLFLFTPLLLLSFGGFFSAALRKNKIYIAMTGWFLLQLVMTATQKNWWGGWCFGPRLMTETLPSLAIAGFLVFGEHLQKGRARQAMLLIAPLAAFGIFTHTVQGLYNKETVDWNDFPNIDGRPDYYIWNWKQTQLFADAAGNHVKRKEAEILQELSSVLPELRPGANLLYGEPGAITRTIYDRWEKNGTLPVHVHNNLYSIEQSAKDTFWITASDFEMIRGMECYRILAPEGQPSLGDYLRSMENYNVLLSVSDEGSYSLSESTRAYFRSKGSAIDSLHFREGYAALFLHGKLFAEQFEKNDTAKVSWTAKTFSLRATSNGKTTGNNAQLLLNGQNLSGNHRGFNVLVVDDTGNVIDNTCFDTHVFDARVPKVFAVVRSDKHRQ